MENDKQKVKNLIFQPQPEWLGIEIYGGSGSGKTALAQCVYDDFDVSHHFEMRAWVTVGTSVTARDVLESLCYSLSSGSQTKEEIAVMGQAELPTYVCKKLGEKRCLIVLDDVCSSNNIWENQGIMHSFPENHDKGSRIIVTTSSNDVTGYKLMKPDFKHDMKSLEQEQKRKLFEERGVTDPALQEKICTFSNLPLGIVVLASVFKGKNPPGLVGSMESENIQLNGIKQIWDFSLKKLPDYLQPCLHYLQQFPPDKWISVEKLCLLWMAEGMVTQDSANKLEVAKYYCNELIASSLVIKEEQNPCAPVSSQRFASCKLRRSIQEDSPAIHTKITEGKRLSIYLDKFGVKNHSEEEVDEPIKNIKKELSKVKEAKLIKSILCFGVIEKNKSDKTASIGIDLEKFKSTEVLEFNGVSFRGEGKGWRIVKLKRLKYLSFQGCCLEELPSSIIENLKESLETLDLRVVCEMVIPDELGILSELRHLYFPQLFRTKNPKLKLNAVKNLEILENFDSGKCDAKDLEELKKLRKLTCVVNGATYLGNILDAINKYEQLDMASLMVKDLIAYSPQYGNYVKDLFACNAIHILHIQGDISELLTEVRIGSKSNFTEMVLEGSQFGQRHLPLLGNLPNLKSLALCKNAFKEKKMVFQGRLFPQLTSLLLEDLSNLNELEVKEAASSSLAVLTIRKCHNVVTLPCHKLAEMNSLKKLITGEKYEKEIKKINGLRKANQKPSLATA